LHNAASGGFLDLVVELVEKFGVDPNNRHFKDGGTALHYAADQGNLEAIRFIVEKYQVDVHVIDMYGDTALTVARRYSFGECAKLLRSYMGVTEEDDEPLNRGFPIGFPGFPFPFPIGPPPPAVGIEVDEEGIVVQCGVM
jgi:ankyrin repeat protein